MRPRFAGQSRPDGESAASSELRGSGRNLQQQIPSLPIFEKSTGWNHTSLRLNLLLLAGRNVPELRW